MSESWRSRLMEPHEATEVCDLVTRVFNEFVAPLYSQEGNREFMEYVQPDLLLRRSQAGHFVLVAAAHGEVVGMIEVRNYDHICLLFVDKRLQRHGIAKVLVREALESCLSHRPDLREITVNSSPNSVQTYERLGFRQMWPEQVVNGIRFTAMALDLAAE